MLYIQKGVVSRDQPKSFLDVKKNPQRVLIGVSVFDTVRVRASLRWVILKKKVSVGS